MPNDHDHHHWMAQAGGSLRWHGATQCFDLFSSTSSRDKLGLGETHEDARSSRPRRAKAKPSRMRYGSSRPDGSIDKGRRNQSDAATEQNQGQPINRNQRYGWVFWVCRVRLVVDVRLKAPLRPSLQTRPPQDGLRGLEREPLEELTETKGQMA